MSLIVFLAALAPLPSELIDDARCVVTIARAAPNDRSLEQPGRRYAAIIGAEIMDTTGRSNVEARGVFAEALQDPPVPLARCRARMVARLTQGGLPAPIK